jgi:hypothetical protein
MPGLSRFVAPMRDGAHIRAKARRAIHRAARPSARAPAGSKPASKRPRLRWWGWSATSSFRGSSIHAAQVISRVASLPVAHGAALMT